MEGERRKHEKRHTRPHKRPYPDCKYHTMSFPNEAEKSRHVDDKHSDSPTRFACPHCGHESKRESNLKQHMESSHATHYERTKGNGKGPGKCRRSSKEVSAPQVSFTEQTPTVDSLTTGIPTPESPVLETPVYGKAVQGDSALMPPGAVGLQMFQELPVSEGQESSNGNQGQLPPSNIQGQIGPIFEHIQLPSSIEDQGRGLVQVQSGPELSSMEDQEQIWEACDLSELPSSIEDQAQSWPYFDLRLFPSLMGDQGQLWLSVMT